MRRKNGILSLEAKAVTVRGSYLQAEAFKVGASFICEHSNCFATCVCWDSQVGDLKLEDFIEKTIRQRMFYLHSNWKIPKIMVCDFFVARYPTAHQGLSRR